MSGRQHGRTPPHTPAVSRDPIVGTSGTNSPIGSKSASEKGTVRGLCSIAMRSPFFQCALAILKAAGFRVTKPKQTKVTRPALNATGKPYSPQYDPKYKIKHKPSTGHLFFRYGDSMRLAGTPRLHLNKDKEAAPQQGQRSGAPTGTAAVPLATCIAREEERSRTGRGCADRGRQSSGAYAMKRRLPATKRKSSPIKPGSCSEWKAGTPSNSQTRSPVPMERRSPS